MGQIIQDDGQMIRFFRLDTKRRFDDSDLTHFFLKLYNVIQSQIAKHPLKVPKRLSSCLGSMTFCLTVKSFGCLGGFLSLNFD